MGAYEDYLNNLQRESQRQQQLESSLGEAASTNPDEFANMVKLSRAAQMQVDAVPEYKDVAEQARLFGEVGVGRLWKDSPKTANFLSNPDNAKISSDSVKSLEEMERQYGAIRSYERSWWEGIKDDFMYGFVGAEKALYQYLSNVDLFGLKRQRAEAAKAGGVHYDPQIEYAVQMANLNRKQQRYAPPLDVAEGLQKINNANTFGEFFSAVSENPASVKTGILQSMGMYTPVLAAAVATRGMGGTGASIIPFISQQGLRQGVTAGVGSGLIEYASTMDDVMQEAGVNMSDPLAIHSALNNPELMAKAKDRALKRGVAVGFFDAVTASLAGKLLSGAKPSAASVGSRVLGETALQAGGGAAGEATAQVVSGEQFKLGAVLFEALAEIPTAIVEVPGNYKSTMEQAQRTEAITNAIETLSNLANANKVRTRDAETFKQWIDQVSEDSPIQNVYINAETLKQSGLAERLAEVSPVVARQLQAAEQLNGEIEIPVTDYLTQIAPTDLGAALIDDLRAEGETMTRREARQFIENQAAELEQAYAKQKEKVERDDTFIKSAKAVEKTIFDDIKGTGVYSDAAARAYAQWHRDWYVTNAAAMNITPEDLYKMLPHRITREQQNVTAEMFNQDGSIKTESSAFQNWFKESKVVDAQGKPMVVYHGTNADFTEFALQDDSPRPGSNFGFYFTPDSTLAEKYYGKPMAVYLSVKNPKIVSLDEIQAMQGQRGGERDRRWAMEAGFDGARTADGKVWIAFSPEQIKSVYNEGTFDPNNPNILKQSATIRAGKETLKKYGLDPNGTYKTRDIAAALEARQRAKYGTIAADDRSKEAITKIAKWMQAEVEFEMQNPEKSGVGWYSEKFQRALDIMGDYFPELKTDKTARNTMTALIAITSDGQKVVPNFAQAMDYYENFRQSGKFESTRGHARQASIDNNIAVLQRLHDMMGAEAMHQYLMQEKTISELKQIAKANGGEMKSDYQAHIKMPMAAVEFGPKLGAFYANLMGAHGYLTMDRWWSRTFNRYRGTLLTAPTQQGLDRFKQLLGKPEMTNDEAIAATVEYRNTYEAKGYKNGTEIEKAANTIYKAAFDALEDAPFNATDRTFMLDAVNKAQKSLAKKGYNLSIADIQAILWYYEKRLYGELGARQSADISYEEAARRVVAGYANRSGDIFVQDEQGEPSEDGGAAAQGVPVGEDIYDTGSDGVLNQSVVQPRDLVIQHNLTADNLLHAVRMGGIPVPSLAVTKKENPLTGFGEITLLGSKEMADPKGYANTRVFGGDIYSPRYPQITFDLDKKALANLNEALAPYRAEGDREIYGSEISKPEDLMQREEFKKYALQAIGKENVSELSYYEMQPYAEQMLREAGAKEKIFQGFTYSGNRRYIPHTLENVVKILKKELRGGENFNYGVGSIRAKYTTQFKSIEQIRKAKDRLMDKAAFENVKKEIDEDFWSIVKDLTAYSDQGERFGFAETVTSVMYDAAKMGIPRALKEYNINDVPQETMQDIAEFLNKLRTLPTEYFEAKILRDVDLAEFSGAVVPEDVKPEVIKALQDRGVKDIRYYKRGDEADRAAKIGQFENLFFQKKASEDQSRAEAQARSGGARGGFNPKRLTTILNEQTDYSTFLHETSHFFLTAMSQMAEMPNATPQMKADMQTVLDWFGVKDLATWNAMSLEEQRPYHEQWAYNYEIYLFENKAPSVKLQSLFDRFSAWLRRVYKSIRDDLNAIYRAEYGQDLPILTGEVRQVMDRMLASDEQIKAAEQMRNMVPLFQTQEQSGMDDATWAAYLEMAQEAHDQSVQDLTNASLRQMKWLGNARSRLLKEMQRKTAETRKEVRKQAAADVEKEPIYQAMRFLKNGERVVDGEVIKLDGGFRLAISALQEMYGEPKAERIRKKKESNDFMNFLVKYGIAMEDKADVGADPSVRYRVGLFRKNGMRLDELARLAAEAGYLTDNDINDPTDNGGVRKFSEMIQAAISGEQILTAEQQMEAAAESWAREQAFAEEDFAARQRESEADFMRSMGFTEAEIVDMQGKPEWQKLGYGKYGMLADEGLHPDMVAEMFGFASGDQMVRQLSKAPSLKEAIEARTDQRMLEEYSELSDPKAQARAIEQALHNEARARFVAVELRHAAKATQPVRLMIEAAKTAARRIIEGKLVRDTKASEYAAAESRATKAADAAMRKGDGEAVTKALQSRLLNNQLAKEAANAMEEVEKGLRYFKKVQSDRARQKIGAEYNDQIDALLERFDLRPRTLKDIDSQASLNEWVAAQVEAGYGVEISPELMRETFAKPYKNMTIAEFRDLVDAVKQIEHMGRNEQNMLTQAKQVAYEAARDEIVASINANARGRTADTRTPATNVGRAIQGLKRFWASHIKAATIARILDGGKDGGPMWQYFIRTANERGDMETTMRAEATEALTKIMAPVMNKGPMGGKGTYFSSIGRALNREQVLAIALNMGNDGNVQRLMDGEGWTQQQLAPVLSSLSESDWLAVQQIWDYMESFRPKIAEKERRIYGKEPKWVDPQPITVRTSDGKTISLRGGYYPIKYDPAATLKAESFSEAEEAKRQLQGAFTSATTRRSFTKERVAEVKGRPLIYTLAAMYSGINDVIHDLAWHEWLIDANKLLRSNQIDQAIRTQYGPEWKGQLKQWVQDVAVGERMVQHESEIALNWLRQGISAAGLGFNVMSAMLQLTGFTSSIVRVGPTYIGRGIAKAIAGRSLAFAEVNAKSSFMANRARTQFRELNELRNQIQGQSAAKRKITLGTYFMMARMQRMVDVPTWIGAYEKAIGQGNDEATAVGLADQAVIDSQGGGQLKDLSRMERGGAALKLFTVFYSYMNTQLNLGIAQTMTAKGRGKLAADYAMIFVLPVVLSYALKQGLTPGGDDEWDWEKIAKDLAAEQLSYLMGMMVFVRELSGVAKTVTGAEGGNRDYSGPAGLRAIADVYNLAEQAKQGEFDAAFRKAAINVLGDFTGLPSAQINRTINGIEALAEGETENPAAVVLGYKK